ncbi:hypothetical protein ACQEVF_41010 [Nonomuraea polychroma]|uniref:hypothetical protein n=1 Tax=Nonomuraea polychroma TaxID=46176 RepID=UPI003D9386E4
MAPRESSRVDAWVLHPDYRTPPIPQGVMPGPWRHPDGGQLMNGAYERLLPDRQSEVVTVWFGYQIRRQCSGVHAGGEADQPA